MSFLVEVIEGRRALPTPAELLDRTKLEVHDPWTGASVISALARLRRQGRWTALGQQDDTSGRRRRALLRAEDHTHLVAGITLDELQRTRPAFSAQVLNLPLTAFADLPATTGSPLALTELREREHALGVAVLVGRDDEVLLDAAVGFEHLGDSRPYSGDTLARWGSVTKVVTTLAALRLVRDGGLALDGPVRDHLPLGALAELPGSDAVTLRHLLTHTAGLPRTRRDHAPPAADIAPGTVWRYSNAGFELVGDAIAHTVGRPFADWMADEVFVPLGMATARIASAAPEVRGYDRCLGLLWPAPPPVLDEGGRGLVAAGRDLLALGAAVARDPDLCRPQRIGDRVDPMRGLGVILCEVAGRPIAFHDGGVRSSWQSYLGIDLMSGTVVVAYANAHPVALEALAEAILAEHAEAGGTAR